MKLKKCLSLLLVLCMCVSFLPGAAFAAGEEGDIPASVTVNKGEIATVSVPIGIDWQVADSTVAELAYTDAQQPNTSYYSLTAAGKSGTQRTQSVANIGSYYNTTNLLLGQTVDNFIYDTATSFRDTEGWKSITIPVYPGDHILSSTMVKYAAGTAGACRLVFFNDSGYVTSSGSDAVKTSYQSKGYYEVPTGVNAVEVGLGSSVTADDYIYILNAPESYRVTPYEKGVSNYSGTCGSQTVTAEALPNVITSSTNIITTSLANRYWSGSSWTAGFCSYTFPVKAGDVISASSFDDASATNRTGQRFCRVVYFNDAGTVINDLATASVQGKASLTVPSGATTMMIGFCNQSDINNIADPWIHILNAPESASETLPIRGLKSGTTTVTDGYYTIAVNVPYSGVMSGSYTVTQGCTLEISNVPEGLTWTLSDGAPASIPTRVDNYTPATSTYSTTMQYGAVTPIELPNKLTSDTNLYDTTKACHFRNNSGSWTQDYVYTMWIPVHPGDKIYANSVAGDGSASPVTWFNDNGYVLTEGTVTIRPKHTANGGYIVVPDNVNLAMIGFSSNVATNELYILNANMPETTLQILSDGTIGSFTVYGKNGGTTIATYEVSVVASPIQQGGYVAYVDAGNLTIESNGTVFVSATSSDSSAASVAVENGDLVVTPKKTGNVTINAFYQNSSNPEQFNVDIYQSEAEYLAVKSLFEGKTVAILGDSISCYEGISTGSGSGYYNHGTMSSYEETWWGNLIRRFGATLGTNASRSGARVNSQTGTNSKYFQNQIGNLDDLGTPDVILFYAGTNDIHYEDASNMGSFDPNASYANKTDTTTTGDFATYVEAYTTILRRMKDAYPNAQIICLLPVRFQNERVAEYAAETKKICEYLNVDYVDLANTSVTSIHPGAVGFSTEVGYIIDTLYAAEDIKNDTTPYLSLQIAVNEAKNGDTLTLQDDVTESIVIPEGKNITLDLNGHKLTNSSYHTIFVKKGAILEIKGGTVDNITNNYAALMNYGTVTITSGTFTRSQGNPDTNFYYTVVNRGVMTIDKGVFTALEAHASLIDNGWNDATYAATGSMMLADGTTYPIAYSESTAIREPVMTINGGTFTNGHHVINNDMYGRLTIKGGDFIQNLAVPESVTSSAVIYNTGTGSTVTTYGGNVSMKVDGEKYFAVLTTNELTDFGVGDFTINGGMFTGKVGQGSDYAVLIASHSNTGNEPDTAALKIKGGSFNVDPSTYVVVGYKASLNESIWSVAESTVEVTFTVNNDIATNNGVTTSTVTVNQGEDVFATITTSGEEINAGNVNVSEIMQTLVTAGEITGGAETLALTLNATVTSTVAGTITYEVIPQYSIGGYTADITNAQLTGNVTFQLDVTGIVNAAGDIVNATHTWAAYTDAYDQEVAAGSETNTYAAVSDGNGGFCIEVTVSHFSTWSLTGVTLVDGAVAAVYNGSTFVNSYSSVQAAIDAAYSGYTVVLLDNVAESVVVQSGDNIILDLNGNTLTNSGQNHTVFVKRGGILTIEDSSSNGTIDNLNNGCAAIMNYGSVIIKSGKFTRSQGNPDTNFYYTVVNRGVMTIDDGSFVAMEAHASLINNGWNESTYNALGSMTLADGSSYPIARNEETATLAPELTINGGSFKDGHHVINNDMYGVLTINGGNFEQNLAVPESVTSSAVIYNTGTGSTITTYGGTVSMNVTGDKYFAVLSTNELTEFGVGEFDIQGGTFYGRIAQGSDVPELIAQHTSTGSEPDTADLDVSAGSFDRPVPITCCADGYIPAPLNSETNMYTVSGGSYVAATGDVTNGYTGYTSVQDAINASSSAGTVTLLADVAESVVIYGDDNIILDLNGHKLTNEANKHTVTVSKSGTLEIKDSNGTEPTGALVNGSNNKATLYSNGTVTITSGTLTRTNDSGAENTNTYYVIENHGTMTISGGSVLNPDNCRASLIDNGYADYDHRDTDGEANPSLTITGGTFKGGRHVVNNDIKGEASISGGYFEGTSVDGTTNEYAGRADVITNVGTLNISGGEFKSIGGSGYVLTNVVNQDVANATPVRRDADPQTSKYSDGILNVTGGTFTGKLYAQTDDKNQAGNVADTNVSGGQFSEVVPENCCADGYSPVTTKNAEGYYGVEAIKVSIVSVEEDNGSCVATVYCAESDAKFAVFAARYNGGGQFLSVVKNETALTAGDNPFSVEIGDAVIVRFFVVDNNFAPACPAKEYRADASSTP